MGKHSTQRCCSCHGYTNSLALAWTLAFKHYVLCPICQHIMPRFTARAQGSLLSERMAFGRWLGASYGRQLWSPRRCLVVEKLEKSVTCLCISAGSHVASVNRELFKQRRGCIVRLYPDAISFVQTYHGDVLINPAWKSTCVHLRYVD